MVLPELLRGIFTGDALKDYTDVLAHMFHLLDSMVDILFLPPGCSSWNFVRS